MSGKTWFALAALCALALFQASPAQALSSDGLAQLANNVLRDLGGANGTFYQLFRAFCVIIGVTLVGTGIYNMTRREKRYGGAIATILVGSVIFYIPQFMDILTKTIFAQEAANPLMSEEIGASGGKLEVTARIFVSFSVFMIQVVGFFAVYRGLKTIVDVQGSGQFQPTQMRAAYLFLGAGIVCINIVSALALLARSMGDIGIEYYNLMFSHINAI